MVTANQFHPSTNILKPKPAQPEPGQHLNLADNLIQTIAIVQSALHLLEGPLAESEEHQKQIAEDIGQAQTCLQAAEELMAQSSTLDVEVINNDH